MKERALVKASSQRSSGFMCTFLQARETNQRERKIITEEYFNQSTRSESIFNQIDHDKPCAPAGAWNPWRTPGIFCWDNILHGLSNCLSPRGTPGIFLLTHPPINRSSAYLRPAPARASLPARGHRRRLVAHRAGRLWADPSSQRTVAPSSLRRLVVVVCLQKDRATRPFYANARRLRASLCAYSNRCKQPVVVCLWLCAASAVTTGSSVSSARRPP